MAAKSVTVRLDEEAITALVDLRRRDGTTQSEAVRRALLESSRRRHEIENEVARLAVDPAYQREVAEWQEFAEDLDDSW